MKLSNTPLSQLSIFEALIIGVSLHLSLLWIRPSATIPLINFYPEFMLQIMIPLLSIMMIIFTLYDRKYLKYILITSLLSQSIILIYGYSGAFAFRNVTMLTLLLNILYWNPRRAQRHLANQIFLAFLFLFAALQKMNAEYLSGKEFVSGGTFVVFFESWFPFFLPQKLPENMIYLPHVSIIIELLISIGILLRPLVFSHVIAFFLLLLSYAHPPVLFVYVLLLPVLISINDGFSHFLSHFRFNKAFRSPYFWVLAVLLSIARPEIISISTSMTFILITMFIYMHIYYLVKNPTLKNSPIPILNNLKNWRLFVVPVIMFSLYLGSYYVLPSPIGFKMFSGQRFQLPHYKLIIQDSSACRSAEKDWFYSQVADASWSSIDHRSCYVRFPTQGGLLFLKNKLCEKFSQTNFILMKSNETLGVNMTCHESTHRIEN